MALVFSIRFVFIHLHDLENRRMLVAFFSDTAKQMLLLVLLLLLPIVWLLLIGRLEVSHEVLTGDVMRLITVATETSFVESFKALGFVMVLGSIIHHHLPFGIIPRFLPLVGRIDRLMGRLVGLVGFLIIILVYQVA